ncbi:hypothetical protein BKA67DRAFT_77582 [Truncatella angustata]|uniref:Uncharacterized protein n=1 Tax=Truncatella angustata TaxID=152316 RepID=A0A9P8UZT3_9PEZI|nr:uncharacterized protein BKA67DRAFT_77582 [Truncatella angustata]KAH6661178.1 hypothetical protein BKA67DRAFT_77582 [Truncatella angustata]
MICSMNTKYSPSDSLPKRSALKNVQVITRTDHKEIKIPSAPYAREAPSNTGHTSHTKVAMFCRGLCFFNMRSPKC